MVTSRYATSTARPIRHQWHIWTALLKSTASLVRHLEPTASPAADAGIGPHLLLPTYLSKHGRNDGLILELRSKSILHQIYDSDELAHVDAEISQW